MIRSIAILSFLLAGNAQASFQADPKLLEALTPKVVTFNSNMPPRGDQDLAAQTAREYLEILARKAPTKSEDIEVCIIPPNVQVQQPVCTSWIISYTLGLWRNLVSIAPEKSLDFADFIVREYPHSKYANDARLVSAAAAQRLGKTGTSTKIYQDLLAAHPDDCSQEIADALISLIADSGPTTAILSQVDHYIGACAEAGKQPAPKKYMVRRRAEAAAQIGAIKAIASQAGHEEGNEFVKRYFLARRIQKQLLSSNLDEDREELVKTLRGLLAAARSDNWKAYLQFLIGNTESKTEANGPWIAMTPNEDSTSAFESVLKEYPRARFPVTDPAFWVTGEQPIAAQAHLKLARAFETDARSFEGGSRSWVDQVDRFHRVNQPGFERAVSEYEAVIRDFGTPSITDEKGSSVLGDAYIGLLRLYEEYGPVWVNVERTQRCVEQNCPYMPPPNANTVFAGLDTAPLQAKINELNQTFVTRFPNMQFLWNGWWFGATRPEAYIALAKEEKDPAKKASYLFKAITENPNSWTGKVGSGDVGRYDKDAFATLMKEAPSDNDAIKACKQIIASNADPEIKGIAENKIKELQLHSNASSLFKKPVEKKVGVGVCEYTYYYDGAKFSDQDFEGFLKYSPVQWMPIFGNQDQLNKLQEATATLPPEIKPLLECYASEVSERKRSCPANDLWQEFLKTAGIVEIRGACDDSD